MLYSPVTTISNTRLKVFDRDYFRSVKKCCFFFYVSVFHTVTTSWFDLLRPDACKVYNNSCEKIARKLTATSKEMDDDSCSKW